MNPNPDLFPDSDKVRLPPGRPVLCIIVDAEEEFEWNRPVSSRNNTTASVRRQQLAQDIFSRYHARPTYLVTYPIAADPSAVAVLRDYMAHGQCDVGTQLHPWVTPPFDGESGESWSYPGNLPVEVEREKLRRLTGTVGEAFGKQPMVYKAGRYGFGPNTSRLLEDEGYRVDTSLIPRTRYADAGGPDFAAYDYGPFWFGGRRRLLELPVTRALTGWLATSVPSAYDVSQRPPLQQMRLPALLARSRLLERITLSPEGSDLPAMLRLTRALLARGERIFTFSYHSPSLAPGNTPYVRNEYDLAIFLDCISGFLSFFRDELGGVILTAKELHDQLRASALSLPPAEPAPEPPVVGERRCLVVANTFPPVHGGSAIVYDSLGRFGEGRVSVLAPQEDYRDGHPIPGWREFDRRAPFRIDRIRLLRTLLLEDGTKLSHRLRRALADLRIRVATLRAIRRIVREQRIGVVCIGELVAGGWLAATCRRLFGVKTLIYVHGEEISTRSLYDQRGQRKRRSLANADGIIAVSRFTRDTLTAGFGVPAGKIELVSNGVNLARFAPRPRSASLVARYGLEGRRVLLTVGRLYPRKGMDRVIECLPEVLRSFPDLVYLIVGGGTYQPALAALAEEQGVRDHVVFAGAVPEDELTDHYALGDVFIMANREMPDGDTEGFGLVFLEANACGLPVIAGTAGGSVDAVTDMVNGLVVNGDDIADITRAILRLFADDALCATLRASGAEVARASGWDQRVPQFLRFCERVAGA